MYEKEIVQLQANVGATLSNVVQQYCLDSLRLSEDPEMEGDLWVAASCADTVVRLPLSKTRLLAFVTCSC